MNINPWNLLSYVFGWFLLCLIIGIIVLVAYSAIKVAYTNFIKHKQSAKQSKNDKQNLQKASVIDVIKHAQEHCHSLPKTHDSTDSVRHEFFLKGVEWALMNYSLCIDPDLSKDLEND